MASENKKSLNTPGAAGKIGSAVGSSLISSSWSDLTDDDSLNVFLPTSAKDRLSASSMLSPVELALTGRIKIVLFVGRGGNGKSVQFRAIGERAVEAISRPTILAAADLGNRSSAQYFENIEQPDGNGVEATANFLHRVIRTAAKEKWNALVDMGAGGELALLALNKGGKLLTFCESLGVELVVLHVMTASVDNVSVFASLEREGFQPRASALIFNETGIGQDTTREAAFELINKQASIRAAKHRGVPQLWLPALPRTVINEVEGRRLLFGDAARGKLGPNPRLGAVDPFHGLMIEDWLERLWFELSPIRTWLPGDHDGG